MLNADLVYFSWTGNTKKVFKFLSDELEKRGWKVSLKEIKPIRDFPYLVWLLLSFIPNLGVKIHPLQALSDVVFLGMPKWTFNCPPVTAFLKKTNLSEKTVFLVITYGGFDEKRYARSMIKKIEGKEGIVKGFLLIKRKMIESGEYEDIVRKWIENIDF